jgi:uncharacterized damage-inducible protein DinB
VPVTSAELLSDAFDRIQQMVTAAVRGLTDEQIAQAPGPEANTIGWLVWHLTRIQDDHVAGVAGTEQVWTAVGWYDRFALPFPPAEHGYGHGPEQVAAVRPTEELLIGYHDAVHAATQAYVRTLTDADLDRVVDTDWDPPVTLGVRLVSVISDDLQHVGQAAYVRGLLRRAQ